MYQWSIGDFYPLFLCQGQPESILEALNFAKDVVIGKYQSAKKDNEFIYHDIASGCVPVPDPVYYILTKFSTNSSLVCTEGNGIYYFDDAAFSTATKIYTTNVGIPSNYAISGWYSNGTIKRYWDNSTGNFNSTTSCGGGGFGDIIDANNGQSCFIAGTSIELESGIHKFIENIIVGDTVITFNEETKLKETGKVYEILSPTHYDIITYLLDDGTTISSTEDHPYYIQDGNQLKLKSKKPEDTNSRYDIDQEVYQIKLQDNMIKSDGTLSKIIDMTTERSEGTQTYLLRVDHNHNFYANGVLVHNK